MGPTPLRGLRVAAFVSLVAERHVGWALASRGAVVDRVLSSTGAIDALLSGRVQVLVTDRVVPGVVLVLQARHLLPALSSRSFGDECVECLQPPVDPAALAAAVLRAARRVDLGVRVPPALGNGSEAA